MNQTVDGSSHDFHCDLCNENPHPNKEQEETKMYTNEMIDELDYRLVRAAYEAGAADRAEQIMNDITLAKYKVKSGADDKVEEIMNNLTLANPEVVPKYNTPKDDILLACVSGAVAAVGIGCIVYGIHTLIKDIKDREEAED